MSLATPAVDADSLYVRTQTKCIGSAMSPQRIICLTEETTETLYLLGEGERVVGVSGYTVDRQRHGRSRVCPPSFTPSTTGSKH